MSSRRGQESDRDGRHQHGNTCPNQDQLAGCGELACDAVGHDALDPLLQIRPSYARHTGQRRFQTKLARFQNAGGVNLGMAAQAQHFFIARALAF
jgi:hypothetical protein